MMVLNRDSMCVRAIKMNKLELAVKTYKLLQELDKLEDKLEEALKGYLRELNEQEFATYIKITENLE